MTGTVAAWEAWTDMAFPTSSEYVIPEGLVVLRIDREHDLGVYIEPNIWVQHRQRRRANRVSLRVHAMCHCAPTVDREEGDHVLLTLESRHLGRGLARLG